MSVRAWSGVIATIAVAGAAILGPSPAMAFSNVTQTGVTGDWGVLDNPSIGQEGARCYYAKTNGIFRITRVRVGPPQILGAYSSAQWVGWRFKILGSTNNWASFKTYYTSPIWKDKASDSAYADSFANKSWYPSSGVSQARLKVQVTLFWYKPGTKTTVDGKAVGVDDNYSTKYGSNAVSGPSSECTVLAG